MCQLRLQRLSKMEKLLLSRWSVGSSSRFKRKTVLQDIKPDAPSPASAFTVPMGPPAPSSAKPSMVFSTPQKPAALNTLRNTSAGRLASTPLKPITPDLLQVAVSYYWLKL